MAQPQIEIKDYSAKSIVLRSIPADFFKTYSGHLNGDSPCKGSWGPYLKEPPGSQNVLPGWIFPKRFEAQVRQTVDQIVKGQLPQAPPKWAPQPAAPTFVTTVSPLGAPTFIVSPQPSVIGQLRHPGMSLAHPGLVPSGPAPQMVGISAQVSLPGPPLPVMPPFRVEPEVERYLELGGYKYPIKIEQRQGDSAVIVLPDGQKTSIKLENSKWQIPGFAQEHTILI